MKKEKRIRVTFSLPAALVRRLDSGRAKGTPRSRAAEDAIEEGIKARERRALDEEIRAYYAVPPTEGEKAFTRALGRIARKLVIDDEPASRRKR